GKSGEKGVLREVFSRVRVAHKLQTDRVDQLLILLHQVGKFLVGHKRGAAHPLSLSLLLYYTRTARGILQRRGRFLIFFWDFFKTPKRERGGSLQTRPKNKRKRRGRLFAYRSISRVTGQWSEPCTCIRISAARMRSAIRFETMK